MIMTLPFFTRWRTPSVLPGFGVALGITLTYLTIIVLVPLAALLAKTMELSWPHFIEAISGPRVIAAYKVTFLCALAAAAVNAVLGMVLAWVLVRYDFWGKRIVDALIDVPFALPTAVAGIALTAMYAEDGWIGEVLMAVGIKVAYTPLGIIVALVFVGLPFVVRTVEPVLQDLDNEVEEAAASLGATRWQTFSKVIFPQVFPALITGFALAFARGLGEYGSVIFIAGNLPMLSEIVPLLIVIQLEQYNYASATALALVMLLASFAMLLTINLLQRWKRLRAGAMG